MRCRNRALVFLTAAGAVLPALALGAEVPKFGPAEVTLSGEAAPASAAVGGFSVAARGDGPQAALMGPPAACTACVRQGEEVVIAIPIQTGQGSLTVTAEVAIVSGREADARLAVDGDGTGRVVSAGDTVRLTAAGKPSGQGAAVRLKTAGRGGEAAVRWRSLRLTVDNQTFDIPVSTVAASIGRGPPPVLPALRPPIEQAFIEWDWRIQDGVGTVRAPSTYAAAIRTTLDRARSLLDDLRAGRAAMADEARALEAFENQWKELAASAGADDSLWESLWRQVHQWRRRVVMANPLAKTGPLVFAKQVPGAFSHQLTQYYGRYARPGGGIFVLEEPGQSMKCRQLAASGLPEGSYQHPEVSFDGRRVLFSYCQAEATPADTIQGHHGRYYHLYEMAADGSGLRQLTDGPFNDFAPKYLPDGRIVFISTRRGGWHRCGAPGCETYTLAACNADGSGARPISWHETHEWDPAVLDDGRIVYTRWDYVDRHAVYYEQLWTVRQDGSAPAAFYGNNTFNPVGLWEARPVPLSSRVIATAAAHHAMTAGSIVLVDVNRGVDGPAPITRLTPDAPFPESEAVLLPAWRAMAPRDAPPPTPEAQRWPGHCYRSPYPLSEKYFLAAYSFEALIGEAKGNAPNMFGIYLVDAFGNKELLYRDPNIASLWPVPLRPRPRPPLLTAAGAEAAGRDGTFLVQDVYQADPALVRGSIKRLRIMQVLPKSTPGINNPPVGLANASPGKQVLGTVPIEADGSAYFRAPAGVPLAFQALDELGRAVQIMRSITYLQPGENASCIGCHEPRTAAPPPEATPAALARPPSTMTPGPRGSNPLSYPILVQPVLDEKCVSCHNATKKDGGVDLTGQPQGHYTVSYNALAPRVPFSAWTGSGNFQKENCEPLAMPDRFGARASPVMKLLLAGHQKVALTPAEIERLATWMDSNALFYGTFDPQDQARQQRGEEIAGPKLQ